MGIDKEFFFLSWFNSLLLEKNFMSQDWSSMKYWMLFNNHKWKKYLIDWEACSGVNISWPLLDLYLDCNWKVVHEENQHFMIRCLIIIISVHLLCITNAPRSQPKKWFNKRQLELAVCMPKGTSFAQKGRGSFGCLWTVPFAIQIQGLRQSNYPPPTLDIVAGNLAYLLERDS